SQTEADLVWKLFHNYNSVARPVINRRGPVVVSLDYQLFSMASIVSHDSVMHWNDENLAWNESEFDNISRISVPAVNVWMPDVSIKNGPERIIHVLDNTSNDMVTITSDGEVYFNLLRETTTMCNLSMAYFPFDKQTCEINMDSFTYTTKQVELKSNATKITLSNSKQHGQWHIIDTEVETNIFFQRNYSEVSFILYLKRDPQFYFTYLIYPCIVSSLSALMVFLNPFDSKESINFSITVLLSFHFFLTTIFNVLPKSETPYLTLYVIFVMFLASFSLISTILILTMHY
ncbi:hypothetical protein HELRODRAFT_142152, partial [Helobdella robusta]|uniref:Neurotransmitter-gated ion-channel ligand-binding domain-containing protein n=1 Tax=Helobdella robusta TaxID=6412 RepID=T1EJ49_HELRO